MSIGAYKFKKKYQKSDRLKTHKVLQTAEQNLSEVKSPSENTTKLKLTPNIEDHANCVSVSEKKALELEKQEHVSVDNMWNTNNRTEQ